MTRAEKIELIFFEINEKEEKVQELERKGKKGEVKETMERIMDLSEKGDKGKLEKKIDKLIELWPGLEIEQNRSTFHEAEDMFELEKLGEKAKEAKESLEED